MFLWLYLATSSVEIETWEESIRQEIQCRLMGSWHRRLLLINGGWLHVLATTPRDYPCDKHQRQEWAVIPVLIADSNGRLLLIQFHCWLVRLVFFEFEKFARRKSPWTFILWRHLVGEESTIDQPINIPWITEWWLCNIQCFETKSLLKYHIVKRECWESILWGLCEIETYLQLTFSTKRQQS